MNMTGIFGELISTYSRRHRQGLATLPAGHCGPHLRDGPVAGRLRQQNHRPPSWLRSGSAPAERECGIEILLHPCRCDRAL